MATASAGRADKGSSRGSRAFRAPLQHDRLAIGGQGRGKEKPKARQPSSCAQTQGAIMSDPEIEELRDKVHCAVVLERTPSPWKLDRSESTKLSLKYRRGKGEILIVSQRWADRKGVLPGSPTWRYLARKRFLPSAIIEAASAAGVLREGPAGSAWFAHFSGAGSVAHVDIRGPSFKGSLAGGAKSLFRMPASVLIRPRLVLAEAAIDALSVAAVESLRANTLYAASGGGMGPSTIAALEALLTAMAALPGALFCSAADANGAGDRFAERHKALAEQFAVRFERLRPSIDGGDWNDFLCARSEAKGSAP